MFQPPNVSKFRQCIGNVSPKIPVFTGVLTVLKH
nr:MAG TPA: hypothetical protein [Bacteriophage sp.]DAW87913.1 MAG TPA: hypothetical protein [Bacteriophage sp.]